MIDDINNQARGKSLMDLISAMQDDSAGKIPALRKKPEDDSNGAEPIVTIKILAGGEPEAEPDPSDPNEPSEAPNEEEDPFEALLKKKQAEQGY